MLWAEWAEVTTLVGSSPGSELVTVRMCVVVPGKVGCRRNQFVHKSNKLARAKCERDPLLLQLEGWQC